MVDALLGELLAPPPQPAIRRTISGTESTLLARVLRLSRSF